MWVIVVSSLCLSAPPELVARTLDGREVAGTVTELSGGRVVLKTGEQSVTIEPEQLLSLKPRSPRQPEAKLPMKVELVDGSRLSAGDFEVKDGQVTLTARDLVLTGPAKAISVAHIKAETGTTKPLWTGFLAKHKAKGFKGDVLVVTKGDAVDYFEGVLYDTGKDKDGNKIVKFELEGEMKEVRFDRVDGIIYLKTSDAEPADPVCILSDGDDALLRLKSVALKEGRLEFETQSGLKGSRGWEQVAALDFSAGKVMYLGAGQEMGSDELAPVRVPVPRTPIPYAGFDPRKYEPRSKNYLWVARPKVGGTEYERGVVIPGEVDVTITYPLRGKFRKFQAVVGINDLSKGGPMRLVIKGDGKELFSQVFDPQTPSKAVTLDVTNVRLLDVETSRASQLQGSRFSLCEAKVSK